MTPTICHTWIKVNSVYHSQPQQFMSQMPYQIQHSLPRYIISSSNSSYLTGSPFTLSLDRLRGQRHISLFYSNINISSNKQTEMSSPKAELNTESNASEDAQSSQMLFGQLFLNRP